MNRDIAIFGQMERYSFDDIENIYLGTVEDFLNMTEKGWLEMRQSILTNFGAIWLRGIECQLSKLCFTGKIDEMRSKEGENNENKSTSA